MAGKARTASIAELARDGDGWSPLAHASRRPRVRRQRLDGERSRCAARRRARRGDVRARGAVSRSPRAARPSRSTARRSTAAAGTVVFVPDPATKRAAVADEAGTTVFAVGGQPDAVFRPRAWETERVGLPALRRGRLQRRQASADRGARPVRGSRGAALQPRLRRGEARRDRSGDRAPRREHRAASVLRGARAQRRGSRRDQGRSALRRDRRRGTDGGLDPADRGAAAARDAHGPLGGCVELPEHPGDLEQLLCLSASLEHGLACFIGTT